jgi:argininosuccinate lyase
MNYKIFDSQIESDIFAVLTLEGSMQSRKHTGGTAPEQVQAAIQKAKTWLS